MAIISFPYDSQLVDGVYDRAIKSVTYRQLLSKYFTTGVFPNPSTQCQVYPRTGMKVSVRKGSANINGLYVELEEDVEATIEQADTQGRYDRIVLRHDDNNNVRATNVVVIKGTAGASPQAPSLTRNETVYDICLATVYVRAGATSIFASDITDTRLNTNLCGIVSGTIKSVDTTTLYNQIQSDLYNFKQKEQADFEEFTNTQEQSFLTWFEGIKGILGEDEAGNLLNLIQENQANIEKLQYTGNLVSGETFSGKASNKGVKLHKVVGKSGNVVITEIYSNGETGTNTETKTNTVKTSLTLAEGDIYEDGIITRANGKTEIFNIPTIPSYYPNTNVWTDNTVPTDMEWEVLAEADNSLEIQKVESNLQKANLLDNSEFINGVINQQGLTEYTMTSSSEVKMGIDRWLFSKLGKMVVNNGYMTFQSTTQDCWFSQRIYIDPTNKKLTFTCKVKDQPIISKNIDNIQVGGRLDLINDESVSIYLEYDSSSRLFAWIYLKKPNVLLNMSFLKLEYGDSYTGLGKWNQTEELIKCQYRYCELVNTLFVLIGGNVYFGTNTMFPISMAKLPKITYGEIKNLSGQTLQITPNFEGRFNLRAIETVQFLESVPENASVVIFSKIIADSNDY